MCKIRHEAFLFVAKIHICFTCYRDISANHAKVNLVTSFAVKNHMELKVSALKKIIPQNTLIVKVIYLLTNVLSPLDIEWSFLLFQSRTFR